MNHSLFMAIYQYTQERSPLTVLLFIAAILTTSVMPAIPSYPLVFTTVIMGCLILFTFRITDDIADLPIDKLAHPTRFLCRHEQNIRQLKRCREIALAVIGVVSLVITENLQLTVEFLLAMFAVWSLFFSIKVKLPTLLHALILNATIAILPVYAGLITAGEINQFHILMAVFFWSGGFAHDLSHSIVDRKVTPAEQLKPLHQIDQKGLAILSCIAFLACTFSGSVLFLTGHVGSLFIVVLILNTLYMFYLEHRLIRRPCQETAHPFYIFGFLFFLLPALANTLQEISLLW
ncbi:UbiA family prenyltransferase [Vibrio mangrovi]|uniref:Prenyltransferase n=1 Tax=Vibrio mangrovi TaxID=474394 RepID=A0A1Y6IMY8_9VIBR|nr:UbiA family prenyltransferase [Vibrio mangrovi]MDW6004195.1 UbiA family prenyltransferase [Vibrio mangrovi]SMR99008.1 prenyltransferase [Vibrio mangrovi]